MAAHEGAVDISRAKKEADGWEIGRGEKARGEKIGRKMRVERTAREVARCRETDTQRGIIDTHDRPTIPRSARLLAARNTGPLFLSRRTALRRGTQETPGSLRVGDGGADRFFNR